MGPAAATARGPLLATGRWLPTFGGIRGQPHQPASWVLDRSGIYYDATTPSDLETFLANHAFSAAERQRAAAFRKDLLAAGLTKYNLQAEPWRRPHQAQGSVVRLVVGQVPRDASLRFGVPEEASTQQCPAA